MADAVLKLRIEFAERLFIAHWHEHRVVAEAAFAARRPDEDAVDSPVERLGLTIVRPGDRQRAGEVRRRSRVRLGRLDLPPDLLHRAHPVAIALGILGPARREDAGAAME